MIEPLLRKFDWILVKPIWIGLIAAGVLFLFQSQWLMAGAMIGLAVLGVGSVAALLHRERSAAELASGYPHRSTLTESAPPRVDSETARRLSRAMLGLALVLGAAAFLLAWHFGIRWYWSLAAGLAVVFLVPVLLAIPLALIVRSSKDQVS